MENSLDALKIIPFLKQLNIYQRELKRIKRIPHFANLIYISCWDEVIVSRWAPNIDLNVLQLLNTYTGADIKNMP